MYSVGADFITNQEIQIKQKKTNKLLRGLDGLMKSGVD